MSQITPFVKRMRAQGGTLYTFSSAVEDIGLNINERNTVVKMSHFAMLDIPEITAPENLQQNRFNLLGIDGALQQYDQGGSIKDGTVLVAESFQNYALNLETILLSQDNYNPALQRTVSERVFWKWIKETGAIRWIPDSSNAGYWIEEIDTDSSVGYNSVVKYVGEISAGSVRTDTFGTYNETYVLVPTSHGQTRVYFKQDYDDNYQSGMELGTPGETYGGPDTILGRQNYTKPHPDALSYQAFYDVLDSSIDIGSWTLQVDASDGSGYVDGWWYTAQGKTFADDNYYVTDVSTVAGSGIYNYKLKYTGAANTLEFYRSNVDALEVELDIDNLRNIFGDSTLTFDQMAIEDSVDDSFEFNAILLYYSIYNQTLDKVLATNLLGILFLDRAAGNTSGFPDMEIEIPAITKLQSTGSGFGTAYSFRINVKSDNMIDDTGAVIYDESTSSQTALESWSDVFASLEKSLSIMNSNSQTLQYIADQYQIINSTQNQQADLLADLQYQVNDVVGDVTGTAGTIALFADGDDPLVDSSIYMEDGKIGIFNPDPSYAFHVDTSLSKFMDIIIQNAVYDTSLNVILGYGSPLQVGASTYQRGVKIYDGDASAAISIQNRKVNIKANNVTIESSTYNLNSPDVTIDGSLTVTGNTQLSGNIEVVGYVKDGSVESPDFEWQSGFLRISGKPDGNLITDGCIGSGLTWNVAGQLDVTGGGGGSSFLYQLLDVSIADKLAASDGSILVYDLAQNLWFPYPVVTTLGELSDTSIGTPPDGELLVYDSGESKWLIRSGLTWDGTTLEVGSNSGISTSGNDMIISRTGGDLILEAQSNISIEANTDVSISGGTINIDGDLTLSGTAYNIAIDNLQVDSSLLITNIPVDVPDVSQYVLFVKESDNRLYRTVIWDASYLAFVDGVDNRIVTAGGPNSIKGEAKLTFDGSTLELDGAQDMFIQQKSYSDTSKFKNNTFYIKGSNALHVDPCTSITTTLTPTYYGPLTGTPPGGAYIHTPGTNFSYVGTPYGSYTLAGSVITTNTFLGNVGDTGGDLNISAGDGANASGGVNFNRGGMGGDLILHSGSGGIGSGTGAVNGVDGNIHIDGTVINLDANNVDIANQIRLQGDPLTRIDFGTVSSQTMRFHLRTGVAGDVEYISLKGTNPSPYTVVINEDGFNMDFRIEGDNDPSLFFTNGNTDRVGIGTTTPSAKLEVKGSINSYNGSISSTGNVIILNDVTPGQMFQINAIQANYNNATTVEFISATVLIYRNSISGNPTTAKIITHDSDGLSLSSQNETAANCDIRLDGITLAGGGTIEWSALRVN